VFPLVRALICALFVLGLAHAGPALATRRSGSGGVAVLIYHHFVTDEEAAARPQRLDEMTMSVGQLRSQLDILAREGARFLTASEFADHLSGARPAPPKSVLLVIDDGYESVYRLAWPILRERGVPSLVALIVGPTEDPADWLARHPKAAPHMSWEQVREMLQPVTVAGITRSLVSLASHTYDMHEHLARKERKLSGAARRAFHARLLADLVLARQMIVKRTGERADFFVWPHGGSSSSLRDIARRAGHHGTFTDLGAVIREGMDPLNLTRVHAGSGTRALAALTRNMRNAGW
jgi:biofilm PGA synthesis lipoprotein PgaB